MNNTKLLLALGAALLLAPLTPTFAQSTWETVDALTPWRGRDIVADTNGNFISLAIDNSTSNTSPGSTDVSVSADHGATWQTVGSIAGYALKVTVAPDGALFASGNRTATVSGRAVVWQSLDYGVTWSQSDPWAGQTTQFISMDVAAGNSGAVYLCGYVYGSGRWFVRKGQRTASGLTWSTADNIPGTQPNSIFVRPGTAGQPDDILVCGKGGTAWTVRHSANGGATWATIDSYGGNSNPTAVTAGPDGSIYVFGGLPANGWIVRKSSNGGASWSNVDFVAKGWPSYGRSLIVDAFGRVFAVGWVAGATSDTWLVRGSTDGGATWATTDSFLPAGTTRAHAMAVASDELGNVCVVGETATNSISYLAPIRRLAAP